MEQEEIKLLKCVSDETRYQILLAVKDGEQCVCDIIKKLKKEQSLISHHLHALRKCGLVKYRRKGKKKLYRISDLSILELLKEISNVSKKFCAELRKRKT